MSRWAAVAPSEREGAWEGQLRLLAGRDTHGETKTDECGHLHGSHTEAMQCSQETAERLNRQLSHSAAVPAQRVPPDYYLG